MASCEGREAARLVGVAVAAAGGGLRHARGIPRRVGLAGRHAPPAPRHPRPAAAAGLPVGGAGGDDLALGRAARRAHRAAAAVRAA